MSLPKPLGIAFEEVQPGQGVLVDYLLEGSNAEQCGRIQPGDILVAVTAYKVSPISSRLPCLSPCLAVYPPILHPPVLPPCASIHRARSPVSPPPSLCPPSQAPSAMSRFERKLIPCRCARARAGGQLSECVSA